MNEHTDVPTRRKWLKSALMLAVVMVIVLSCTIGTPAATSTPKPTDTPLPTDTSIPTDTPEPTATKKATANRAATQRAQQQDTAAAETEFAGAVLGEVQSKLDEVGEMMGYGNVVWLDPSSIEVDSSKPNNTYYKTLDSSIQAGDFAFHTNIRWETKQKVGIVNCIIMFRMGADISMDAMYWMRMGRISGIPHIWFELYNNGNYVTQSDYGISNYIRDGNGDENEIILVAKGNQFTAYANGKQVEVWWNSSQDSGGFALGTWQDTGSSVCTFSDNWIWAWS
jgi:hypothetical protein